MKTKISNKRAKAFTITEQMVVMLVSAIVILGMGAVLVDSQKGWNRTYDRAYGDVATDGYVAQKTFEAVVRKSSTKRESTGTGEITVYYYNDPLTSTQLDRYARFYKDGDKLMADYGQLDEQENPQNPSQTDTLAQNVEDVSFSVSGVCLQMILSLDNGSDTLTVVSSAVRHNQ